MAAGLVVLAVALAVGGGIAVHESAPCREIGTTSQREADLTRPYRERVYFTGGRACRMGGQGSTAASPPAHVPVPEVGAGGLVPESPEFKGGTP